MTVSRNEGISGSIGFDDGGGGGWVGNLSDKKRRGEREGAPSAHDGSLADGRVQHLVKAGTRSIARIGLTAALGTDARALTLTSDLGLHLSPTPPHGRFNTNGIFALLDVYSALGSFTQEGYALQHSWYLIGCVKSSHRPTGPDRHLHANAAP